MDDYITRCYTDTWEHFQSKSIFNFPIFSFSYQLKVGRLARNAIDKPSHMKGRLAYIYGRLANTASYSFYGHLLICIPLKAQLKSRTWMQLIWEMIPESRSEGQENWDKERGKGDKMLHHWAGCSTGTLAEGISEFCLQNTGLSDIYLQTPIPVIWRH